MASGPTRSPASFDDSLFSHWRSFVILVLLATRAPGIDIHTAVIERDLLISWVKQSESQNAARLERVRQLFSLVGCVTREQPVKHSKLPNLICEIPGPDDAVIVVGAHYDKVTDSEGVIDNWTGTALLPALYQALKPNSTYTRQHKILFIAFAEEEKGLVGSHHFASQIKSKERTHYQAMVNLDSIGLGPISVWPSKANPRLMELLGQVANATKIPVGAVNLDQVGLSDSASFAAKKIPVIDFHSITQATWPLLHTVKDNPAALKLDDYWTSYQLIAQYIAYLDQKLVATPQ